MINYGFNLKASTHYELDDALADHQVWLLLWHIKLPYYLGGATSVVLLPVDENIMSEIYGKEEGRDDMEYHSFSIMQGDDHTTNMRFLEIMMSGTWNV